MLQPSTITFLKELKRNNNKPWFDENRKRYEAAKENFALFIDDVIRGLSKKDVAIAHIKARDCLFRINRDVRFSKNKQPYKTNFGAYINNQGKKSMTAGYYFHLEPGDSFVGGGVWQPPTDVLAKLRQEIDYNLADFEKIISAKPFKSLYGGLVAEEGQTLARVPKGYEANNPAAAYLKHKSFVVLHHISDTVLTGKTLIAQTLRAFEAVIPFNQFFNNAFV